MFKKISPRWLLLSALALVSLAPTEAAAQLRDPAAAQALFDQGRELSRQGRYTEACPKFLESNRLDPGIGTQFHLAECYQQSGQIATAWATFLDVASIARSANELDREKAAVKRAQQLEPRLPKLTVNVPQASQVQGLEVHRDGMAMGAAQWGTPVPADPGEHVLTVSAPGRKPLSRTLKLEEGKALTFEVPALETDDSAASEAPPPVAPEAAPSPPPRHHHHAAAAAPEATPPPTADKSSLDAWPLALAGVGVVGLTVATVFALKADSTNTKSKADCDAQSVCGSTGYGLRNDALSQGNVATASFIAGSAFLLAGGIVWDMEYRARKNAASAPRTLRASAAITPSNAALYLQGNF